MRFQKKQQPFVRLYPILFQEPIFETGFRKMSGFLLQRYVSREDIVG